MIKRKVIPMKKFLALVLALGMILSLCACGGDKNDPTNNEPVNNATNNTQTSSKEDTTPKFEVTVVDQNGDAVSNAWVQLCKDSCLPKQADENGVAVFDTEITDGYKLSLMSCPEGYECEYVADNYIYLESGITEYEFVITKK